MCRFRVSLLRARGVHSHRASIPRRCLFSRALLPRHRIGDLYCAPPSRRGAVPRDLPQGIAGDCCGEAAAPKEHITRKISKKYGPVTRVFTVQILQRPAILFFPAQRRDRQMARQTQDTRDAAQVRSRSRSRQLFRSLEEKGERERRPRGEGEERRSDFDGNDFPRILLPKRRYLGGVFPGSFLLFPYFIFQSRNSRPC